MSVHGGKSRDAYPDVDAWLADLDHPMCRRDREGRCWTMHCVQCGAAVHTGLVPCENGCNPRAWKAAA